MLYCFIRFITSFAFPSIFWWMKRNLYFTQLFWPIILQVTIRSSLGLIRCYVSNDEVWNCVQYKINEIVDFLFFRQDKVEVAVETKVVSNEKTPLQSDEIKYWKKLLKAFLQPAMLLLFVAAAIRHTGWFLYLLFLL